MITIRELTVRFESHTVFDGFSCDIPLDGNTILRGASGSGKTTLLRILAGLQHLDSGCISGMDGLRVSMVFQEDRLLPWYTALENAALASGPLRAKEILLDLGLGDFINEKPATLSGGMKRRIAIARALSFGGDLLLLDEPFTGLDDAAKEVCAEALRMSGIPLVAAVHSDAEAALLRPKSILQI